MQITDKDTFKKWITKLKLTLVHLNGMNTEIIEEFPRVLNVDLRQSNQKIGNSNINFWNKLTISSQ